MKAHSYFQQTCALMFLGLALTASERLYGVECYYAECLLGVVPLYQVVLGIGILVGLVQLYQASTLVSSVCSRQILA